MATELGNQWSLALDYWYCRYCDRLDCFCCFVALECAGAVEVDNEWEESTIDRLIKCTISKVYRHGYIKWHHENLSHALSTLRAYDT